MTGTGEADLLRVPAAVLEREGGGEPVYRPGHGPGGKEVFHAALGLAVTGIAGPSGGSRPKSPWAPSGSVWPRTGVEAKNHRFHGSREEIKALSAQTALDWLRRELKQIGPIFFPLPQWCRGSGWGGRDLHRVRNTLAYL